VTNYFSETEERQELRKQVAKLASKYGRDYFVEKARSGGKTTDLWLEIGKNGYLGINIPEEYGGGGGGIGDIAAVCEELAAQGCPLLLMVVSPAICGTIISRYGTEEQKQRWLPGICDGTSTMAFAITEPDAGTNTHNITTTARRDGDEWVLNGRKIYISGVDEADNVLVVARAEDAKTGKVKPVLFVVPTDAAGLEAKAIPMEIVSPELQFTVFIDDVRLPDDALVGEVHRPAVRAAQPRVGQREVVAFDLDRLVRADHIATDLETRDRDVVTHHVDAARSEPVGGVGLDRRHRHLLVSSW
jgi:alkylation response protein AidB-like acyl-CoA dehydrogenase